MTSIIVENNIKAMVEKLVLWRKPKLLELFTFGATSVSIQHGCECVICVQFGQSILGTLTKINGESLDIYNDLYNPYKS